MSVPRTNLCSYQLDRGLNLVTVGDGWAEFAAANGAPELSRPPLGRPLFTFIADPTTRHLYEQLFARVGTSRRPVTFGIRCDSANRKRYLDLRLAPRDDGFTISTVLIREEPLTWPLTSPSYPLDHSWGARSDAEPAAFVCMCGWCNRIEIDRAWYELEQGLTRLRLFELATLPSLTHGICNECRDRMTGLLDTL